VKREIAPPSAQTAASELVVLVSREDSTVWVYLLGELDMCTRAQVESALLQAESSGAARVELDFGGLTFMDSSGVHVVLDALGRAREKGHRLVLHEGPGTVQKIFTLTGTDHLFGAGS
jgi:anti-anti-sigma factor